MKQIRRSHGGPQMVYCRIGAAICPIDMVVVEAGLQSIGGMKEIIPSMGGTDGHCTLDRFLVPVQAF